MMVAQSNSRKTRVNGKARVERSFRGDAVGLRISEPSVRLRERLMSFLEEACVRTGAINAVVFNTGSINSAVQVTAREHLTIHRFLMKHLANLASDPSSAALDGKEGRESLVQCLPLIGVHIPGYGTFHLGLVFAEKHVFFEVVPTEILSLQETLSELLNDSTLVIHEWSLRARAKPLCSICNGALSSEIAFLTTPTGHEDSSSRVCDTCAGKLLQLRLDNEVMLPHHGTFEV